MTGSIVDIAWLEDHLDGRDLAIIDMRAPQLNLLAHVPGAVNLPELFLTGHMGGPPPAASLSAAFGRLGVTRDARIVAYDDGVSPAAARQEWGNRVDTRIDAG